MRAANVVEDVHFFGGPTRSGLQKPSPGWQFTFIDCAFEAQREAAILEHEAGLTLIRPHFQQVKTAAVEIEPEWTDQLWVKDACLENISGPAFIFGMEKSPRTEINLEGITCHDVPVFAAMRDNGKSFAAPANIYAVTNFFPRTSLCRHWGRAGNRNPIRRRAAGRDARHP